VSLEGFLSLIVRSLREADIPFMLTGSLAAAYYGAPRATQDLGWKADLIVRKSRPFSVSEFGRRQHRKLLGLEIAVTTLEALELQDAWERLKKGR